MNKLLSSLLSPHSPKNTTKTPFQIASDLHLEIRSQYSTFHIPPFVPYLILAGDIGQLSQYTCYLSFLSSLTPNFARIFLVLGNHEFYHLSHTTGLEAAKLLVNEPVLEGKVVLMSQTRYDIPESNVTVLGCTLWSKISEEARGVISYRVQDFNRISDWTTEAHNIQHDCDVAWLKTQIQSIQKENLKLGKGEEKKRILVVSHHAPSMKGTSSKKYEGNEWQSAFATELLRQGRWGWNKGEWEGVDTWVFGHTHFTTEIRKGGVRVVSNQRGIVIPGREDMGFEGGEQFDVEKVIYV